MPQQVPPVRPTGASGMRIGRIFGIPIYIHTSWFIIFALITLSLATQFKYQHPAWTAAQHWTLGLITSFLFFGSVLFHELSHSVVARHYKIPVDSITLFVFGGVSRISRDPDSAGKEFNVAIAGPLSSLFLAGCCWLVGKYLPGNQMVTAAAYWLAEINAILAVFNLVPGFPLDGGRILRGITWGITKNFDKATRIATLSGKFFAYLMILWGIWDALSGNFLGGIWLAFIGWFLLSAAQETYIQNSIRSALTGMSARDIMNPEVPTVARDMSLEDYAHEVLKTGRRFHIVTGMGEPVGLVTLHTVQKVPREEWASTSIQAVMHPVKDIHWASPDESALGVFERLMRENVSQMPVLSNGHIIGVIGRESLLRALQMHETLGHPSPHAHTP
ncbi:MAG TPA: site-2 protease family protein [Candidatus Acidoferrales bacterium]|nr:site-2 protease family protein [Candidatus Acidoferrales bacterium]